LKVVPSRCFGYLVGLPCLRDSFDVLRFALVGFGLDLSLRSKLGVAGRMFAARFMGVLCRKGCVGPQNIGELNTGSNVEFGEN
jgi:hypothetical protein